MTHKERIFMAACGEMPDVLPYVPPAVAAENMRSAAAFAALFITTLIVAALFAWSLARLAKYAGLSGMDGKFGAIFGMLRGGLVVIALVWVKGRTFFDWRFLLRMFALGLAGLLLHLLLPAINAASESPSGIRRTAFPTTRTPFAEAM